WLTRFPRFRCVSREHRQFLLCSPPESKSRILYSLWVVIELNVPVFSGDGKVEMIGSDSEHEFPRCDGHVGRILRNNRCKKTDW
ncbi:hypothetical protein NEL76_24100, partial [Escherichia coli]|nr:hypothetical protein [Escherichia coli]MDI0955777.1 hypothetical protein [Escherichia coli]